MGSPTNEVDRNNDEGPQTAVTISRGYWMGKYLVTQGDYLSLMGSNPSFFNGVRQNWPQEGTNTDFGTNLSRPVETVGWGDATNYCAVLTQRERGAGRIATNSVYRLPTEAEWEYGCRAWTSTRFSYGDDPDYSNLDQYGWFDVNSGNMTHPVGQKLPNPWGLYDMHGNVWEWCQDWYGPYPGGTALDPQGPPMGSFRMVRGGAWRKPAEFCRSALRGVIYNPDFGYDSFGFRVVLAPGQP
jgi:formylglycine-generating enzyme required for sulfatase activity